MDGELLRWLYHRLLHDPTLARTPGCTYGDGVVLLAHFYAASNNGSLLWASDPAHWPAWCRAAVTLPSYSQLNKRLKTASVTGALASIDAELTRPAPARAREGRRRQTARRRRLLPRSRRRPRQGSRRVGVRVQVARDRRRGRRGDRRPRTHAAGRRRGDGPAPRPGPPRRLRGCTLRDDANYDSNPCYGAVADAGGRMVASRRKPGSGLGHHPQHPDRLRAIEELERTAGGSAAHRRVRNRVEQCLAHLTNLPFGLFALPNFVRRLPRVRLWVATKIMLYHLHKVLSLARVEAA